MRRQVPYRNHYAVDTKSIFMPANSQVSENKTVVGIIGAIGDPVLLRHWVRRIHCEHLLGGVVLDGGFHFHGVVTVAELGESEAADLCVGIDFVENFMVAVGTD